MALDTRAGHQLITLEIEGKKANLIENESGAHRLQRVPPTERNGRVHSSTVTVAIISESTEKTIYDRREDGDFEVSWFSGTGCGGQFRNKHQNSCRIKHIPTGIVATAQTRSRINSEMNAKESILVELDKKKHEWMEANGRAARTDQIGAGITSEKRRSIRFQADQVIDHVTGKRITAIQYMKGYMDRLW